MYDDDYMQNEQYPPISLTLPKTQKNYEEKNMLPFFDGLIPEGWLLKAVCKNWKLSEKDRMGILLVSCRDCIGSVSIEEDK